MDNVKKLPLRDFTRYCMSIAQVPSSYLSGLTLEEQLLWLCSFLTNEVIPTVNNNGEAVEELQALYVELKNYVDNYFDNLDIQEEVNTKLEEMAQSGELAELIAQYLEAQAVIGFNTCSGLAEATNLAAGSFARTMGRNTYSDGYGAFYRVRTRTNVDDPDGYNLIALTETENLVAERIVSQLEKDVDLLLSDPINVKDHGVTGDGLTDDTQAIQDCIDNNPHKTLYFPTGNYLISEPLNIKSGNEYTVNLNLDNGARIFTNTEIEELIAVGKEEGGTYVRNNAHSICTINGGIWDARNTTYGIYLTADKKQTRLLNLAIIKVENTGIYIDRNVSTLTSISSDSLIDTVSITGTDDYNDDNIGIYLKGTDNELNEIRITSIKKGIVIDGGGNLISNGHLTCAYNDTTVTMVNNSTGVEIKGWGANYFTNFYVDTYGTCFLLTDENTRTFIDNMHVYYWLYDATSNYKVFEYVKRCYVRCSNSMFEMPNQGSRKVTQINNTVDWNTRQNPVLKNIIQFENCEGINITEPTDLFKEMQLNKNYVGRNYTVNPNVWSVNMTQNAYYPLVLLSGGRHEFIAQIANDQISKVTVQVSSVSGQSSIICEDLQHTTGGHYKKYYLALVNGFSNDVGEYFAYLAIKATDADSSLNPCISNFSNYWLEQRFSAGSTTALTSPTVITESNMNNN